MDSFSQTLSQFRYLQLLVPVGLEQRESHGAVASVSRAPHHVHVQHRSMRTTRVVAFQSSGATNRFWLFASITCDHETQRTGATNRCWLFASIIFARPRLRELAPQTVLRRLVVRDLGPFVMFCGQEHFATGRFVARIFLRTGRSVSGPSCTQALWLHSVT